MAHYPEVPELGNLRIATPDDVLRCAIVACAGFLESPVFRWERPDHHKYPEDTLASYINQAKAFIRRDDVVMILSEDEYNPIEAGIVGSATSSTVRTLYKHSGWPKPTQDQKVVVGWIAIVLAPGSERNGQFGNKDGEHTSSIFGLQTSINT